MRVTKSRNLNCACGIAGIEKSLTEQIEPDMRVCPYCGWQTYTQTEWDIIFGSEFNGLFAVEA